MNTVTIREIQKGDNAEIAQLIRTVLIEFKVPKVGTAYADPQLDCMFETYAPPKSGYFVIEADGKLIGGAGISHLIMKTRRYVNCKKCTFCPRHAAKDLAPK